MTHSIKILLGAYIPIPPEGKFSDNAPMFSIALYGVGCIITLVLMYALIRKTRRDKTRRKRTEKP